MTLNVAWLCCMCHRQALADADTEGDGTKFQTKSEPFIVADNTRTKIKRKANSEN